MFNVLHRFRGLTLFVLFAALSTLIMATIHVAVQQDYRTNANDPQIEATEEIVNALNQGAPANAIVSEESSIDMDKSLSTFIIIFDKDGKVVIGSGKLDGQTPTPPSGTFDTAKNKTDNRFTWEPKKGVRVAAVLRKADGDKGFVLAGRSMREVENREKDLMKIIGIAWGVSLLLSALLAWVLRKHDSSLVIAETNVIAVEPPAQPEPSLDQLV